MGSFTFSARAVEDRVGGVSPSRGIDRLTPVPVEVEKLTAEMAETFQVSMLTPCWGDGGMEPIAIVAIWDWDG